MKIKRFLLAGKFRFLAPLLPKSGKVTIEVGRKPTRKVAKYDLKGNLVGIPQPGEWRADAFWTKPISRPTRGYFWREYEGPEPPTKIDLSQVRWYKPRPLPPPAVEVSDRAHKKRKVFNDVPTCAEHYGMTVEQVQKALASGEMVDGRKFYLFDKTRIETKVFPKRK